MLFLELKEAKHRYSELMKSFDCGICQNQNQLYHQHVSVPTCTCETKGSPAIIIFHIHTNKRSVYRNLFVYTPDCRFVPPPDLTKNERDLKLGRII